jgi:hypothetical protein
MEIQEIHNESDENEVAIAALEAFVWALPVNASFGP